MSKLKTEQILDNLKKFYLEQVKGDKAAEKEFKRDLDVFLDDLLNNDVFGTEGQLDPRGDKRD